MSHDHGILAFGAYIPRGRLQRSAVATANAWFAPGLKGLAKGERAVVVVRHLALPRVEVEVLGFERGPDGRVRLAAKWWLMRGGETAPLAGPSAELYGAPLPEADAYDAAVASMSQVYPWDRGTNFAVEIGRRAAKLMMV